MCSIFISGNSFDTSAVGSNMSHKQPIVYVSIPLDRGDTLWDIAIDYSSGLDISIKEYIKEIQSINNLSDDKIIAGQHLIVPILASNESSN